MAQRAKYLSICDEIIGDIRTGRLAAGDRLPTERELADRFAVHRMTVRQATDTLVRRGFAEKQLPKGVFIRRMDRAHVSAKVLHLICGAFNSPQQSLFIEYGTVKASRHGLQPRVQIVTPGNEHLAADAVASGEAAIVFNVDVHPQGEIGRALRKADGRAVVMGARLEHLGIPSVVGDDFAGIRAAVDHLFAHGHRKIALVCSRATHEAPLLELHVQYWREAMRNHLGPQADGVNDLDSNVIRIQKVPIGGRLVASYEAVKRFLKTPNEVTAFIGLDEQVTEGAVAALHRAGRKVPDDVSVVAYAGTYYSAMTFPEWTSVDVSIKQHIDIALEMIDLAEAGELSVEKRLSIVKPRLIQRDSVSRLRSPAAL